MDKRYKRIWDAALPFQDFRDDKGHAEVVTQYATQICKREKANSDVVIPTAILHDIGWSKLTKPERMLVFDKNISIKEKLKVRYKHQNKGVEMASKILKRLNYDKNLIPEILEIISQHDTRKGFISDNEGAVRDADKLWRYDKRGFISDRGSFNFSIKDHLELLHNNFKDPNFLCFESSVKLAKRLLNKLEKEFS